MGGGCRSGSQEEVGVGSVVQDERANTTAKSRYLYLGRKMPVSSVSRTAIAKPVAMTSGYKYATSGYM